MALPVLQIIIASTRPGRVGLPVANWFAGVARADARFDVELVDLAEQHLPLLDEPNHPRLRQYTQPHTIRWSRTIERSDAVVFVHPEYNYSFNAAIKNAIDYLNVEWAYKPVGFVSYGGISGGLRAAQALKQVVTTLRMAPIVEAVPIPFVSQHIDDEGAFAPTDIMSAGAAAMLAELERVAAALAPLRRADRAG